MEPLSAWVLYASIVGVPGRQFSGSGIRSSRIMTRVTPAGARFFCAPAKSRPNFETSRGSLRTHDEMSATRGMSPVSGMYS